MAVPRGRFPLDAPSQPSLALPTDQPSARDRLRALSVLSYKGGMSRCLAWKTRIEPRPIFRAHGFALRTPAKPMRYSRSEHSRVQSLQKDVARAEADYQRFRAAYLEVARNEPGHEVALAMIGADMDRAHAALQALIGLPRLPFTHEPSTVVRREAQRLSHENS
jgi:hypothetical protein